MTGRFGLLWGLILSTEWRLRHELLGTGEKILEKAAFEQSFENWPGFFYKAVIVMVWGLGTLGDLAGDWSHGEGNKSWSIISWLASSHATGDTGGDNRVVPAFLELIVHQGSGSLSRLSLGWWNLSSFSVVCDDLGSHAYFVYSLERASSPSPLCICLDSHVLCIDIFFLFCLLIFLLVLIKGRPLHSLHCLPDGPQYNLLQQQHWFAAKL